MTAPARPAIPGKVVGLEVGPLSAMVDARWLMAYAAGLGETASCYYDTAAPGGPTAHPLFAVCWEWPAVLALRAKTIREELLPLGVHAGHRLEVHRLPAAGDRMVTRARLTAVRDTRAGALVVIRLDTVDRNGRPVATTDYSSIFRGVPADGEAAVTVEPLPALEAPPGDEVRWEETLAVPAWAPHVYTEGARIWNPIHTDVAAARAAGLPGPVLHGTATLGLALSRVLARDLGGEPARVRGVRARFAGLVPVPTLLTVRGRSRAGQVVGFDALDPQGRPVLTAAAVRVAP